MTVFYLIKKYSALFLLITVSTLNYASASGPFSITPQFNAQNPVVITPGGAVTLAYTVTSLAQHTTYTGINVQSSPLFSQKATGTLIGCDPLGPGDTCTLSVTVTQPINASDYKTYPIDKNLRVCLASGHTGPVCSGLGSNAFNAIGATTSQKQYVYIANEGNSTISICSVNTDGTGGLGTCQAFSDPTIHSPADVILNNDATMAYVANLSNGTISMCPVNSSTGMLETCTASGQIFGYTYYPSPGLQISNNTIYVTDEYGDNPDGYTVHNCQLSSSGIINMSTCTGDTTLAYPNGRISFNSAGNIAYVASYQAGIESCQMNSPGVFTNCSFFYSPGYFSGTINVALNPLGNAAYVVNDNTGAPFNSVASCTINIGHSMGPCNSLLTNSNFVFGTDQNNLFISSNQHAYISDPDGAGGDSVYICAIVNGNIDMNSCDNFTDPSFYNPTSVWMTFN